MVCLVLWNLKTGFFAQALTALINCRWVLNLCWWWCWWRRWREGMFSTLQCFFTSHNVGLHPSDLAFKCSNQGLMRFALKVLDFLCRGVEDKRWTGRTFYVQSTRPEVVTPSSADVAKKVFTVKEMIICLVFAIVQIAQIENWCKQQKSKTIKW